MTAERALRVLVAIAILPASVTFSFLVFWSFFESLRKRPLTFYMLKFGCLGGLAVAVYVARNIVFAHVVAFPGWVRVIGWVLLAISLVFGTVADRQIGIYVRAFLPFFEPRGRIQLRTTGAYGIVRHPIYASGIFFQLAVFLATGVLAVAAACVVFTLGAMWFTRQEEKQLVQLLDDPAEYEAYRSRVPALFPWSRRARPRIIRGG